MVKILIVEDDFLYANELVAQLQDLGYIDIYHSSNSAESLEAFHTHQPDLIIMDIGLSESELNGIELADIINSEANVPILFLSSYSDQQTLDLVKKTTFAEYIVKPASSRQLYTAINLALSNLEIKQSSYNRDKEIIVGQKDVFYIKGSSHYYHKVQISDLLWVESVRGGIEIFTKQKTFLLTASLASFSQQFPHPHLIRVHRSFVINYTQVASINKQDLLIPYLNGQKAIVFSKTYWKDCKKYFDILKSD